MSNRRGTAQTKDKALGSISMQDLNEIMDQIDRCWLESRVSDLGQYLHEDVVMALPGFKLSVTGRQALINGFAEFCENARVHRYETSNRRVDVVGSTGVVTFEFEMIYERNQKNLSSGRDLWVFQRDSGREDAPWLAVWRTMLDLDEKPL